MQLKPQQKSKSGQKRINDQIQANRVMVLAEDGPK